MNPRHYNTNIESWQRIATPRELYNELPSTPRSGLTVETGRETIKRILDRHDRRLLAIVGPCSIHDLKAAGEYARRLRGLAEELKHALFIVMRVYFEKPRTSLGWKGFINDPDLDGGFRVDLGLRRARAFLIEVAELGLPAATEALDVMIPQYIGDLISWSAIGARTTESQVHRELASGLSTPVGFKNATDGSLEAAVNAIRAAQEPHHFLGVTDDALPAVFTTTGNSYPHIVLRGGKRPNHDREAIARCEQALAAAGLRQAIMVDCSHGNSAKDYRLQATVLRDVLEQLEAGNSSIVGFMLESHLEAGQQPLCGDPRELRRGVSITDGCIDWRTTEELLREAAARHASVMAQRASGG
ncbi:MAG: 3-deoxy-7-phosphoheptulonate synthase [Kiritimatiellae bacterium]|nr:3-deoxy-7-phosphoheptulonate synthase [Kiritimatiellia bacterium]